eukprot:1159849-Pelagomonas_calceolata.AAC.5
MRTGHVGNFEGDAQRGGSISSGSSSISESHPNTRMVPKFAGQTGWRQTLEPLEELGLDTHTATKLALKLHAHSVQYAYKLASTRRALEKTPFNSHHQDQARATASNPPDPH